MEKSFFGKMFSRAEKPGPEVVPASADFENAEVQFGMGLKFASSAGAAQDYLQAAEWYRKAAAQSHSLAQFNLGRSCHRASFLGLPEAAVELKIEAYKWYRLAAAQGYQDSDTASATLVAGMTHADVVTGNKRVAAFKIEQPERLPQ